MAALPPEGALASPDAAFREHRRALWGLVYRLTGCAADADDLVQETFVRYLERPPPGGGDLRPWLVRVAMNLGRDRLRARRRRGYDGTWLPSPVETDGEEIVLPETAESSEARYDRLESVSFAFLLALEALTPLQRAALLLRDVFDYSTEEAAEALGVRAANVKTTLHRARRRMADYDRARERPSPELKDRTRAALERFMAALASRDAAAVEGLLAEDVRMVNDGGGEFFAARVPVVGRAKVAMFNLRVTGGLDADARFAVREVNGLPALIAEYPNASGKLAPRITLHVEADEGGAIRRIYSVLATRKLTALRPV